MSENPSASAPVSPSVAPVPEGAAPLPAWQPQAGLQLLAMDTSTSVMSVAVGRWPAGAAARGEAPGQWLHTGAGAAQSSATLIPTVQRLLGEAGLGLAQLDAIVFGAGPGSFTGLRTACAVAQGLALGTGRPVLPVDTLLAVAEDWRSRQPELAPGTVVWALLDARMDEIYVAGWRWQPRDGMPAWELAQTALLARPEDLLQVPGLKPEAICAGNVQPVYGERLPVNVQEGMPTADAMLRLAPALLLDGGAIDPALALPRYVRDKVAQTTAEREEAKLRAAGARQA